MIDVPRRAFRVWALVGLVAGLSSPDGVQGQAPGQVTAVEAIEAGARSITEDDFMWRVGVIAHDSMQGRDTPSPGLDRTAEWIASEFRRMGLRGGLPDGGFIQRYPLTSLVVDAAASEFMLGRTRLSFGRDLLPLFGTAASDATGDVVLVSGTGAVSSGVARAIRGNHVILVLRAGAAGVDRQLFQVLGALRGAGAVSVTVTNDTDDARWQANATRSLRPSVGKAWGDTDAPATAQVPLLQVRTSALQAALAGQPVDLPALQARAAGALEAVSLRGVRGTLRQRVREEQTTAPNVVGILDGSDPTLRDEFVVFSGHMDHVGIGTPDERGDSIFNGADDDASGTASVMEIAEAMSALPVAPRRSMLFLLVSGEEKGLWGSEWFAENPTVPLESLVANLNTDMVGRNWPDTIVAIGKEHSDLGETLNRVNGAHPELRMTAIDDLWPEERFYFRSDHYNFAKKGVPILFFFNGTHDDYHGRDDEPDRIDGEKAARITRLVYYLGIDIGNRTERPKWNPESYARIVSDR